MSTDSCSTKKETQTLLLEPYLIYRKKKCTDSHKDQVVASKLAYIGKEQGK
jgi:hypothetical protein